MRVNSDDSGELLAGPYVNGSFAPDGRALVLVIGSTAHVFDVQTGTERAQHNLGAGTDAYYMALSADGNGLATLRQLSEPRTSGGHDRSTRDYSIDVHDLQTGKLEHTVPVRSESRSRIVLSPDGAKLATSAKDLHVYDIATGRELARIQPEPPLIEGVRFTSDGRRLVSIHIDKTALIWDWRQFLIDEEAD